MTEKAKLYTGGCLCGAVRYEATGEPLYTGHCYCADCRKASGSGFVAFMGFASDQVRFSGETKVYSCQALRGVSDRNFCPTCGGLVFGGIVGKVESHTIYAGSLDDPTLFEPKIALFNQGRPDWAVIPPGLTVFERMPEETP
jgi:hypothetical protein